MERYIMFLDWKNQSWENDYYILSNLQIQCSHYQIITNHIFHIIRTKKVQFVWKNKAGFPDCGKVVKNPPANAGNTEKWVRTLDWEDPLEKEMTTHSNILASNTSWSEEPGGLQSMWL